MITVQSTVTGDDPPLDGHAGGGGLPVHSPERLLVGAQLTVRQRPVHPLIRSRQKMIRLITKMIRS